MKVHENRKDNLRYKTQSCVFRLFSQEYKRPCVIQEIAYIRFLSNWITRSQMAGPNRHLIRGWFLTYSQCSGTKEELLEFLRTIDTVEEYAIAREEHSDGGQHFHVFVRFRTGVRWRDVLLFKFGARTADAQAARSVRAVIKYVEKDGDYISNIENLEEFQGNKVRKRNRDILEMGANEAVDQGLVRIEDYTRVTASINSYCLHKTVVKATDECKGIWLYGDTDAGKSQMALEKWPMAFQKSANKWWDGYRGQEVVILDDLGKAAGQRLAYHIKRWTDKWPAPGGEVKNGTIPLPFTLFVITSQWSIQDMFDCQRDRAAIKRRCMCVHVVNHVGVVVEDDNSLACEEVYDGNYDVK